jgi:hypothetical protein
MAKFDEKSRFLRECAAKSARKSVREMLENALGRSQARQVFQKVTVSVSSVKQLVDQFEMGEESPCLQLHRHGGLEPPSPRIFRHPLCGASDAGPATPRFRLRKCEKC